MFKGRGGGGSKVKRGVMNESLLKGKKGTSQGKEEARIKGLGGKSEPEKRGGDQALKMRVGVKDQAGPTKSRFKEKEGCWYTASLDLKHNLGEGGGRIRIGGRDYLGRSEKKPADTWASSCPRRPTIHKEEKRGTNLKKRKNPKSKKNNFNTLSRGWKRQSHRFLEATTGKSSEKKRGNRSAKRGVHQAAGTKQKLRSQPLHKERNIGDRKKEGKSAWKWVTWRELKR